MAGGRGALHKPRETVSPPMHAEYRDTIRNYTGTTVRVRTTRTTFWWGITEKKDDFSVERGPPVDSTTTIMVEWMQTYGACHNDGATSGEGATGLIAAASRYVGSVLRCRFSVDLCIDFKI